MRGLQFQADEKEHHHYAEFGKMHDVLALAADKAEAEGADDDARQEITQDRAHPDSLGDGDKNDRRRQIDEGVMEEGAGHGFCPVSESSQSLRKGKVRTDSMSRLPWTSRSSRVLYKAE
ncbi:MAG: hypothetical protein A4E72_00363 [Syntrophus sp. PtaU1.Bin208]|nr:MAG: hypothetical protein A4E72_00363 [Syntrophus sp. PtaU1.Bin208]